jgi:hypothetical protein
LSIDASFPLAERSRSEQRRPKTREPGRSDGCHLASRLFGFFYI